MLELNALREEEGLELLEVLITKVPAFLEQTVLLWCSSLYLFCSNDS